MIKISSSQGRFDKTCLSVVFRPSHPKDRNARATPMGGAYRATLGRPARGYDGWDRSYWTVLGIMPLPSGRNPIAVSPFCAGWPIMGPDHGAVDHLQRTWHGPNLVRGIHDLFAWSGTCPATELAINARPLRDLFRQVPLWCASPGDPEDPIANKPMRGRLASVRGACSPG